MPEAPSPVILLTDDELLATLTHDAALRAVALDEELAPYTEQAADAGLLLESGAGGPVTDAVSSPGPAGDGPGSGPHDER